jgi:peptidoglycan/LPS O-acetylase OafA/YrhL
MNHASDIRPLTSLRFIAALLVFFSHYSGVPYSRTTHIWQSLFLEGHVGVTIFFVLSGFLITLNYFPAVDDGTFSTYTFFLKRFARILPLYWFMLALTFVSSVWVNEELYAPVPLTNWTLTQSYFSALATSVIITGWSLPVEVAFYLVAPLILRTVAAYPQSLPAAGVRLMMWSIGLFLLGMLLVDFSRASGLNQFYGFMDSFSFMTFFTLFGRGFHFCFGMFLALVYLQRREQWWTAPSSGWKATSLFLLSLVGIGGLQMVMNQTGSVMEGWYWNMGVAVLAGMLILSLTCPTAISSRLLSRPLPVYMGQISYALYLFQTMPIGHNLYPFFRASPPLYYVVMNVLSAFWYEAVERPAHRFVLWLGTRPLRHVPRSAPLTSQPPQNTRKS